MVVRGAGFTAAFWAALDEKRKWLGVSDKAFYEAMKKGSPLITTIAYFIAEATRPAKNIFHVPVDYEMPVEQMVRLGRYDVATDAINSQNFPTKRRGKAEVVIELTHFGRAISSDDAVAELGRMGLRPAELHELLALGATFPYKQLEFPIVGLGSRWLTTFNYHDLVAVPVLCSGAAGRKLMLYGWDREWPQDHRFAAVRE